MALIQNSELEGIQILERPIHYSDIGFFSNIFNLDIFAHSFHQDSISFSKKAGTIRGMHFQNFPFSQGKLINVLQGEILDVFIDLRKDSKTFLSHGTLLMGQDNPLSLFIPRGFAHGFITLKENTLLSYKLDNAYNPDSEITLTWDDETIDINWPSMHTYHISPKDKEGLALANLLPILD